MRALGMIEVRGYLGAVSAADAALKAADVELNSTECISGGLTTIMVVGDVAAVTAAVEAAADIAGKLGRLKGKHVISRVDEMTAAMIGGKLAGMPENKDGEQNDNLLPETSSTDTDETLERKSEKMIDETDQGSIQLSDKKDKVEHMKEEAIESLPVDNEDEFLKRVKVWLHNKKVLELRKIAYRIRVSGLKRTAIKFANKETLIRVIMDDVKRGERFELD